jgi:hypothetical protein
MKNKSSKEQIGNMEIWNKLQTIKRVEPSPFLYERIKAATEPQPTSSAYVWLAAACILVLLSLNIAAMHSAPPVATADLTEVFSLSANNNLYE